MDGEVESLAHMRYDETKHYTLSVVQRPLLYSIIDSMLQGSFWHEDVCTKRPINVVHTQVQWSHRILWILTGE